MMATWEFCPHCEVQDCTNKPNKTSTLERANIGLRIGKLGKFFRVIRLLRMIKLFKLLKNKETLEKKFSNGLKINSGMNRLVMLVLMIIYY